MTRERLPNRRRCETLSFTCGNIVYHGSIGYYDDGRPGEIFLDSCKSGTDVQVAARDSAIALSMALQHGATLDEIKSALTRRANGTPEGPLGILLDTIIKTKRKAKAEDVEAFMRSEQP